MSSRVLKAKMQAKKSGPVKRKDAGKSKDEVENPGETEETTVVAATDDAQSTSGEGMEEAGVMYERKHVLEAVQRVREVLKERDPEEWPRTEAAFNEEMGAACTLKDVISEPDALYLLAYFQLLNWKNPKENLKFPNPSTPQEKQAAMMERMSETHLRPESLLAWRLDVIPHLEREVLSKNAHPRLKYVQLVANQMLDWHVTGRQQQIPRNIAQLIQLIKERNWLEMDLPVPPHEVLAELSLGGALKVRKSGIEYRGDAAVTGKNPDDDEELFTWTNLIIFVVFLAIFYALFFA